MTEPDSTRFVCNSNIILVSLIGFFDLLAPVVFGVRGNYSMTQNHQNKALHGPLIIFIAYAAFPLNLADAWTVHLYRDTDGVPHVHAETEQEAAYGVGYAQAENRLSDLCRNVRIAFASMAEAYFKNDE